MGQSVQAKVSELVKGHLLRFHQITMAPREPDTICNEATPTRLQVVDKALQLPVVSDAAKLAGQHLPLHHVQTIKETLQPYGDSLVSNVTSLKTRAEQAVPQCCTTVLCCAATSAIADKMGAAKDFTLTQLDTAAGQVNSAVGSLDTIACDGLDQLTEKIPALKKETPELYESTKDSAICYLDFAKEYLASFTVAQLALTLTEQTLFAATEAIKYAGLENKDVVKPVVENIEAIRRRARAIRRAGAKEVEPVPAKTIGEASLVGAVAEIFGANYFLSYVGLKVVPVHLLKNETTETLETSFEEETVEEMLSDEKLATYVSDEDPEYEPCEHKAEVEESPDQSEEEDEKITKEEIAIIMEEAKIPKEVAAIIPNDEAQVADEVKLISDAVSAHMKNLAENADEDAIALVEEATVEEPITKIKDLEVESSPTSEGAIVRTEETTETADEIKDVEDEDTSDLEEEDE